MNITKIEITKHIPEKENDKLLGVADIIFDYDFTIHGVKIMDGAKGEYLIFPTNKLGRFITYPITEEMRQYILNALLEALKQSE